MHVLHTLAWTLLEVEIHWTSDVYCYQIYWVQMTVPCLAFSLLIHVADHETRWMMT